MNTGLIIGGPIVVALAAWILIGSGIVYFGELPDGVEHQAGAEPAGSFDVDLQIETEPVGVSQSANYRLEEQATGFANVEGLEIENEPIDYRDGVEETNKTKQPGLSKYVNINFRWPVGFDTQNWRLIFERQVAIDEVEREYDEKFRELNGDTEPEPEVDEGVDMIQIDPPKLVIPAN